MKNKTIKNILAFSVAIALCAYYTDNNWSAIISGFIVALALKDITDKVFNKGNFSWLALAFGIFGLVQSLGNNYVIITTLVVVFYFVIDFIYKKQ